MKPPYGSPEDLQDTEDITGYLINYKAVNNSNILFTPIEVKEFNFKQLKNEDGDPIDFEEMEEENNQE